MHFKLPGYISLIFLLSSSLTLAQGAENAQDSLDLTKVYSRKKLLASGPVMRPTSPNQSPVTSPSTGPPRGAQPTVTPGLQDNNSTPLQQQTNPTDTSVENGTAGGGTQNAIEPVVILKGETKPVQENKANPDLVKATVEFDRNGKGQPDSSLSLSQALDEALIKSPRAAAVRAQLPIAKSAFAQATIVPNPVIFFDQAHLSEGVERRGQSMTWDPPWKMYFRLVQAKRAYDQTKTDLMTTLWQLRADTRRAYTEAIVARETQKTLQDLYELSDRLFKVSSKRFQAGDVPELDVLRARLAISQSQVDLGVGAQRVTRASQQLNVILGRAVEAVIGVPTLPDFTVRKPTNVEMRAIRRGILPDFSRQVPSLQDLLKIAFENRLELKSLDQQLKLNKANLINAYSNVLPNPSVAYGLSTETNLPTGPKTKAPFVTLNLESPVTNLNQGEIAKYRSTGKQLVYQVGAQKNQVIADVSSAYNNLLAARDKIRVYQEHVLADSAEVARLSRRSYEVGQSDINSTLLAQQANVQIRSQYLDAVTSYQGAYTDLEQACGIPLD